MKRYRRDLPHSYALGWPGLPESYRNLDRSVVIPHRSEVESLALPVAVGIALYSASQQAAKQKDRPEAGPTSRAQG